MTFSFHILVESIAFLAACIWGRFGPRYFRLFILLLLYTVINECAGNYFHYCLHRPNFFLYNIYVPIEFGFYSLQILLVLRANSRKRLILTSLLTGLLFSAWNIAFGKGLNKGYNTDTNILLSLLLIFASLVYLYDLLTYSEHIETPIREPMFWIVAGLLFFNFGCLIINALYDYAEAKHLTLFGKEIYSQIMKLLNLLMYSCFTISFVLCYRTRKSIC